MSFPMLSIKASGSPARQNATGNQRSKAKSVIGYFFRKRNTVLKTRSIMNPSMEVVPSLISSIKLDDAVRTRNAYDVLTDHVMSEVDDMAVDVNGVETSLRDACRDGAGLGSPYVKDQKRVKFYEKSALCKDVCCQHNVTREVSTDEDNFEEKQLETMPRRLVAKLTATKKSRFVYSRLLNYLRCKHFMHIRDHHFITTLVADARSWLLKEHMDMEKPITFAVLAGAVTQAFMVNQEELDFRARMKNPIHLDHIEHLNNTMSGELGRVSIFKTDLKSTLASAARRPFTRSVRIPTGPKNLI